MASAVVWLLTAQAGVAGALKRPGCVADEARLSPDGKQALVRFRAAGKKPAKAERWLTLAEARALVGGWDSDA